MNDATIILMVKLTLTPLLIALATLAGRRWGGAVSGLIVGLPLSSGPITLFIALNHSADFVTATATATMLGLLGDLAYGLVYAWLARHARWQLTLASSILTFFTVAFALLFVHLPLLVVGASVFVAITVARVLLPKTAATIAPPATPAPRWDVPLRMILATGILLGLTGAASALGPRLTGLLTPFPLYVSLLTAFAHQQHGGVEATRIIRGLFNGLYAFLAFFSVVAVGIGPLGIGGAFTLALIVALAIQAVALQRLNRSNRATQPSTVPLD